MKTNGVVIKIITNNRNNNEHAWFCNQNSLQIKDITIKHNGRQAKSKGFRTDMYIQRMLYSKPH